MYNNVLFSHHLTVIISLSKVLSKILLLLREGGKEHYRSRGLVGEGISTSFVTRNLEKNETMISNEYCLETVMTGEQLHGHGVQMRHELQNSVLLNWWQG